MVKTVLKIDGMMCGMCEAHMNDLIRKNFKVKKVTSSAKDGETVIISDAELDIQVNPMKRRACFILGENSPAYILYPWEKCDKIISMQ